MRGKFVSISRLWHGSHWNGLASQSIPFVHDIYQLIHAPPTIFTRPLCNGSINFRIFDHSLDSVLLFYFCLEIFDTYDYYSSYSCKYEFAACQCYYDCFDLVCFKDYTYKKLFQFNGWFALKMNFIVASSFYQTFRSNWMKM